MKNFNELVERRLAGDNVITTTELNELYAARFSGKLTRSTIQVMDQVKWSNAEKSIISQINAHHGFHM
ncbi:hypothetical protein [Risungbinella massiliensis]|uniref:hypothetical protein n=1 Tax=Risungbinella massiliensis TaxID=1329796 RepID=UPI0011CAB8F1|nr:hypothetical protein [Risungbinella massiliensis]